MERGMSLLRRRLEETIEDLIIFLDEVDGDPDLEPEPVEDQFDTEADPAENGIADLAALKFVIAEMAKRRRWY
jgi:hypothetical protein